MEPFPAITASIFDIPHIMEAITRPLSFADLRSCILVSRHWHSELIPYLWTDVINFRSNPCCWYETHEYLFLDPFGRQSLAKHARHIRALTCQDSALLPVLVECGCTNLVELNYVIEETGPKITTQGIYRQSMPPPPSLGLDHLAKLIAANPGLQSVSIENVPKLPGGPSKMCKEIWTFMAFLESCPSVTCFYLTGDCLSQTNITNTLRTMLGHRLAALHPHDYTVLHIKSPRAISRSKRGPPSAFSRVTGKRLYDWPGRYGRMVPTWEASGRWENPRGRPYASPTCFAVLASPGSGVLEVTIPPQILQSGVKAVLARCPEIVSLHVDAVESSRVQGMLLGALRGSVGAKVRELRVDVASLDLDALDPLLHGQDTCGIARISVREVTSSPTEIGGNQGRWVRPLPAFLSGLDSLSGQNQRRRKDLGAAIVDLELVQRDLGLGDMLQILSQCANLERFRTNRVVINDRTPQVSPAWVCGGTLRELSVWFVLDGLEMVNGRPQTEKYGRSVMAAKRIAPSVMEQVGGMAALRELGLHVNHPVKRDTSPFLQLAVEPLNGLGMLVRLGEMEKFEVSGLLHSVGHAELVWMKAHWPRLMSLSIPNCRSKGASVQDVDVHELDQDYWKWLESLRVKKGYQWSYGDLVWGAPN
ncbi:hypothetical protein BG000_002714 [Podila horticola]|nr:hypothetical protein BG000_002714 [Podila horticola]